MDIGEPIQRELVWDVLRENNINIFERDFFNVGIETTYKQVRPHCSNRHDWIQYKTWLEIDVTEHIKKVITRR